MIRSALVVLCVGLVVLTLYAMRTGWRHRLDRQAELPPLPVLPDGQTLGGPVGPPVTGLYVGSTVAGAWQDRIAALGVRAAGSLELYERGVLVRRDGAEPLLIERSALRSARLAPGLAGKVVGEGGLLVLSWLFGSAQVDTGFRADDKSRYPQLLDAVVTMVARESR